MAVFWLVVVFVLGEIACIGYLLISRPNGPPDLSPGAMIPVALALNQWHLLLIWCFIGAFSQWMRSLDLVNDEAWTFEQLVLSRFDEIDHQFGELTGKPLPGYLRTDEETEVAIKDPE
jgi:hypothetical protein